MSTSRDPQYLLLWKGREVGPFSLAVIREKLGCGEISRMHQVNFNGKWLVVDEFLTRYGGGDPEARQREEARKREEQLRVEFESKLSAGRAQKAALEERLAAAESRSSLYHLLPPQPREFPVGTPIARQMEQADFLSREPFDVNVGRLPWQSDARIPKQILGFLGSVVLVLGVFCPIISVPVMGPLNYFQNGKGDGTIILVLAVFTVILTFAKKFRWLWLTSGASLGLLIFTFVQFQSHLSEAKQQMKIDLNDNPFAGLADMALESVQLQWGVAVLAIGTAFIMAAAAIPIRNSS